MTATKNMKMSPAQLANLEKGTWKKGQSGNPKGRPKNRVCAILKNVLSLKQRGRMSSRMTEMTNEEIDTAEKAILALQLSDLQLLAKADETPAYAKALAMAAIMEMKNGKIAALDRLRERQYGAIKQQVDITTNGKDMAAAETIDLSALSEDKLRVLAEIGIDIINAKEGE